MSAVIKKAFVQVKGMRNIYNVEEDGMYRVPFEHLCKVTAQTADEAVHRAIHISKAPPSFFPWEEPEEIKATFLHWDIPEPEKETWIKTTDKLPFRDQKVLVHYMDKRTKWHYAVGYYTGISEANAWDLEKVKEFIPTFNVLCWMEIPELPNF